MKGDAVRERIETREIRNLCCVEPRRRAVLRGLAAIIFPACVAALLIMVEFLLLASRTSGYTITTLTELPSRDTLLRLGTLLGPLWGKTGSFLLLAGAFLVFWNSLIANYGACDRLLPHGTLIITRSEGCRLLVEERKRTARHWYALLLILAALPSLALIPARFSVALPDDMPGELCIAALCTLYCRLRCLPEGLRPAHGFALPALLAALFLLFFAAYAVCLQLAVK